MNIDPIFTYYGWHSTNSMWYSQWWYMDFSDVTEGIEKTLHNKFQFISNQRKTQISYDMTTLTPLFAANSMDTIHTRNSRQTWIWFWLNSWYRRWLPLHCYGHRVSGHCSSFHVQFQEHFRISFSHSEDQCGSSQANIVRPPCLRWEGNLAPVELGNTVFGNSISLSSILMMIFMHMIYWALKP